jgi:hypothetical protein
VEVGLPGLGDVIMEGEANLDCAQSDYNDPSYRVELVLEPETMSALPSPRS